jgi:hypothetical protein
LADASSEGAAATMRPEQRGRELPMPIILKRGLTNPSDVVVTTPNCRSAARSPAGNAASGCQPLARIEEFSLISLSHVRSASLTISVKPYFWGSIQAEPTRETSATSFAVNLHAHAQYLVGSHGYYGVTYRPVTILAPVDQLSVGTSVAGGTKGYDEP